MPKAHGTATVSNEHLDELAIPNVLGLEFVQHRTTLGVLWVSGFNPPKLTGPHSAYAVLHGVASKPSDNNGSGHLNSYLRRSTS